MTRPLAATLALVFAAPLWADEKPWVGQKVMPRAQEVTFSDRAPDEKQASLERKFIFYTVLREQGDRLLLSHGGQEGWALKAEWVLLEDAPAHYSKLIRADATGTWAWRHRGVAWAERGEPENTIKDFTEAIRLNPKMASTFHSRGVVYRRKKEYDKAVKDFTGAIRLDPESAMAFSVRGITYGSMKEYDKAIRDYDEAIRLDPKDDLVLNYKAWLLAVQRGSR